MTVIEIVFDFIFLIHYRNPKTISFVKYLFGVCTSTNKTFPMIVVNDKLGKSQHLGWARSLVTQGKLVIENYLRVKFVQRGKYLNGRASRPLYVSASQLSKCLNWWRTLVVKFFFTIMKVREIFYVCTLRKTLRSFNTDRGLLLNSMYNPL